MKGNGSNVIPFFVFKTTFRAPANAAKYLYSVIGGPTSAVKSLELYCALSRAELGWSAVKKALGSAICSGRLALVSSGYTCG